IYFLLRVLYGHYLLIGFNLISIKVAIKAALCFIKLAFSPSKLSSIVEKIIVPIYLNVLF
ncbi:MAG: hypothetical protein ABR503_12435, partial [Chitinophagaceae bacterium]